jgi:sugar/nucleoside kinase (ribokinase family)
MTRLISHIQTLTAEDGCFDLLSVGDITTDAFIELLPGSAQVLADVRGRRLLALEFGTKLPFGGVEIVEGSGNAASCAVACSRLGLRTGLITNVGGDRAGEDVMFSLAEEHVDRRFVRTDPCKQTNYHFVLRYGAERTILTRHEEYEYRWPDLTPNEVPRWLYLSSVAAHAAGYHDLVADWLDAHPEVRLAFEPGTFELWAGPQRLRRIYRRSEVLLLNRDEAVTVSHGSRSDVPDLLDRLHALGPRVVVMTDGPQGAFASTPEGKFQIPIYPDPAPPVDRTGAGDAFAATFVSSPALRLAFGCERSRTRTTSTSASGPATAATAGAASPDNPSGSAAIKILRYTDCSSSRGGRPGARRVQVRLRQERPAPPSPPDAGTPGPAPGSRGGLAG